MAAAAAAAIDPPHVIVVGGGLAGLAASLEAADHGARVTLLDKCPSLGGNSAKATSGINGAESHHQQAQGIEDTVGLFADDTLKSGKGKSSPALVEILTAQSAGALAWLEARAKAAGAGLDLSSITQLGGHSRPRSHRIPPTPDGRPVPVGWTIVSALRKAVEAQAPSSGGRIEVRTGTTATALLTRDDPATGARAVVGVRCREEGGKGVVKAQEEAKGTCIADSASTGEFDLPADAVILTAGGYAFDDGAHPGSLLQEFAPQLASAFPTTNGAQATGDGVKLGRAIGAALVDMDQVQIHPTGMVDPKDPGNRVKILAPEALRGCGGIMVEPAHGRRFVNELTTRDAATAAIMAHCKKDSSMGVHAILLLNDEAADKFGRPTLGFYQGRGLVQEFPSAEAAAAGLGMPSADALVATLRAYGESARAGKDEFGKTVFPVTDWDPSHRLYAILVTPSLHYCMGGLQIDERARVLKEEGGGGVIGGLWAAGEVTGGVHGGNRLGGNSLLECVVFGRIAGQEAAGAAASAASSSPAASASK